VAVAGGDGTVGKVARRLLGSRTPIAVLPMGTANNIGTTLGLTRWTLPEIIKGWTTARGVSFDAGVAEGPWGSECFIEGFGIGLFAEAMVQLDKKENKHLTDSGETKEVIHSVLGMLKKELQQYQPKKMAVRLDGEDLSGDYLLLEALNIRYIGPNLDLVPRADVRDGFLDVVFVKARERAKLSKRIGDLIKHKPARPNLKVRRGRHLQIEWENSPVHIDDRPWPEEDEKIHVRSNAIDVKIQPAALVFLIPENKRRAPKRQRSG
jgi:diacylglycerol kinase family enzyme